MQNPTIKIDENAYDSLLQGWGDLLGDEYWEALLEPDVGPHITTEITKEETMVQKKVEF